MRVCIVIGTAAVGAVILLGHVAASAQTLDDAALRDALGSAKGETRFVPGADLNGDGVVNTLDVMRQRGFARGQSLAAGGAPPAIIFTDPAGLTIPPGGTLSELFLIGGVSSPLFGYSLDVVVTPIAGSTGAVSIDTTSTSFFDARNIITAGGATRDPFFSVILSTADGAFISTNTSDGSGVLPTTSVNDALAEVFFRASPNATGDFEIRLGPASALSDTQGFSAPFDFTPVTISVRQTLSGVCFEPPEPNDECVSQFGNQTIMIDPTSAKSSKIVNGKLEKRFKQAANTPDTWLCVVDKLDTIIAFDNDGAQGVGNGKGSGLLSSDNDGDGQADILIDNGDGTFSLRLVVTGYPDGFDGNCNGFFLNAPHGQLGAFCASIRYFDVNGSEIRSDTSRHEFITGAEAFRLNFTAPPGSSSVQINIDNTCGVDPVCFDHDYMCFSGLVPRAPYCITVIGGLDENCDPTDTQLCWFDKNCNVIITDDDSGPAPGYSKLCGYADVDGNICIGVSGGGDTNCDGYLCPQGAAPGDGQGLCAPHGVCGTYTLKVEFGGPTHPSSGNCPLLAHGDMNMDGVVDAFDLSELLSNWGVVTTP